jgi:sphingomyelin phosphodiesterase
MRSTLALFPLFTGLAFTQSASSILSAIEAAAKSAASCAACEAILVTLQGLAHTGNDAFDDVIIGVCEAAGVEDADVCQGAIGLEGPILAHDLREMTIPSRTAQEFCATVFGLCQYPAVRPYTVSFPSPKPATPPPAPSGKTPIQVVHFSDIHVDLSYETGANYNCTKNICCRPYTTADKPGNTAYPAGQYGNHGCDSPKVLEQSLYAAVEKYASNAAFTLFTGDAVEGAVWLVNQAENTNDIKDAYKTMASALKMPVYAATGNHEAAPVNSFPPKTVDTTLSSQWVYDTLAAAWTPWIGSTAAKQADDYGAYSYVVPNHNLRIISVNTNFWYRENFWLYEKTMEFDPNGQLAWLVSELQAAETAGQRAYIIGHMPFGTSDTFYDYSDYLNQIVNRYEATIAASFFGHTHKDQFELSYTTPSAPSAANAIMTSYICPALTPTSGEPAFRVYSVDPTTFAVLDYTEYSASLEAANYQTAGPTWIPYYSAKATYGTPLNYTSPTAELTPAFWHNVTQLFETNDAVFQQYIARKSRGYGANACTGDCKTSEICQLRAANSQYNCGTVKPGINFKREEDVSQAVGGHDHSDECAGSKVAAFMKKIVAKSEAS